MSAYRERAEQVVSRVATQWSDAGDVKALTDAVYHALVQEANLELRQIFAQMGGQLELARARVERGQPAFTTEKLDPLLDAVTRANAIMEVFMDRSSAAKLVIRIDPEPFDLGQALHDLLRAHGIDGKVQTRMDEAPIVGDRQKLLDAVGHLVTRFYFAARPHEVVVLSLTDREDGHLEGFVGLAPSHLRPEQLMEEMHLPLNVEDVGIEIAYIRAVLERHGGSLFVATAGDASTGFGFTLPLARPEVSP
jgi:light-regulated signal transduction histidine kinase (bacteriophytochrome)